MTTHSDYMTPGQSPLPPIVVFEGDKNNSPAKELIPNMRDCYDINQDDHATVLHSVSLNGLLWKRKCQYQASLTSVPSLQQWCNVMHAYSSVSHTTVYRCHRHFLWRKVYFQYLCEAGHR